MMSAMTGAVLAAFVGYAAAWYFGIVEGKKPDAHGWLTPVAQPVEAR